jgi:N-acetylglucosamine repressor
MRKINTRQFRRATRGTPREINRKIVLNLVREHQPISRAELARRMEVNRGTITTLVNQLIAEGDLVDGEIGAALRGRKPRLLHVPSGGRLAIAVDVRLRRTHVVLSDFESREIARETIHTPLEPDALVAELAAVIARLQRQVGPGICEGIGVVVPGMVDRRTGQVLRSPQLGWRNVAIRSALAEATGLRVFIENAPIACALAHMWLAPTPPEGSDSFAFVAVSDGVGVGLVVNGEVVRGHTDTAGEFGHLPIDLEGPRCLCGLDGCWEAYTSNVATLARYLGLDVSDPAVRERIRANGVGVLDLVRRAEEGDERALAALRESARYLGTGIAGIIGALNPARIIVGGELTAGWHLVGATVEAAARARALTPGTAATPILTAPDARNTRLRGATALLVARSFAAPRVA